MVPATSPRINFINPMNLVIHECVTGCNNRLLENVVPLVIVDMHEVHPSLRYRNWKQPSAPGNRPCGNVIGGMVLKSAIRQA